MPVIRLPSVNKPEEVHHPIVGLIAVVAVGEEHRQIFIIRECGAVTAHHGAVDVKNALAETVVVTKGVIGIERAQVNREIECSSYVDGVGVLAVHF